MSEEGAGSSTFGGSVRAIRKVPKKGTWRDRVLYGGKGYLKRWAARPGSGSTFVVTIPRLVGSLSPLQLELQLRHSMQFHHVTDGSKSGLICTALMDLLTKDLELPAILARKVAGGAAFASAVGAPPAMNSVASSNIGALDSSSLASDANPPSASLSSGGPASTSVSMALSVNVAKYSRKDYQTFVDAAYFSSESSATSFPKFGAMPEWIRLLRDATATEHIKPIWARPHGKEKGARYQPSTIPKNEAKMWLAAALYSKDTAHSFIWDALEKNPVLKVVCQQCDTLLRLTTVDESNEI